MSSGFPHAAPSPSAPWLWAGLRVGLLGGSFNPAHQGHRHVSLAAMKRLGLDQVWWLVSPQNPLKPVRGMAPLAARLAGARAVARHPRIVPTDLERLLGTRYTVDTLAVLKQRFPRTRFVWLIGADNLLQLPRWRHWTRIFHAVPIAVVPRRPYSLVALGGLAARRFARRKVNGRTIGGLASMRPPAWTFLAIRLHPASATALREGDAGQSRTDPAPG